MKTRSQKKSEAASGVRLRHAPSRRAKNVPAGEPASGGYAGLCDFASIGYITFDASGGVLEMNSAAAAFLGRPAPLSPGKDFALYLPASQRNIFRAHFRKCSDTDEAHDIELCLQFPGSRPLWVELKTVRIPESGIFRSVLTDITERKQIMHNLLLSKGHLELALEAGRMGIWEWNIRTNKISWSSGFETLMGLPEGTLGGTYESYLQQVYSEDLDVLKNTISRCLEQGEAFEQEHRIQRPDGTVRWLFIQGKVIRDSRKVPDRMAGVIVDITERREAETKIANTIVHEQQRIGQDLHDSVCQNLTGIAFIAKALKLNLSKKNCEAEAGEAQLIGELINEAIVQTRDLTRGLLAWQIETHGLGAALEELAEGMRKLFKVEVTLKRDPAFVSPELPAAKHLYRITQEAVHNAIKHGRAKKLRVELGQTNRQAFVSVKDDGSGFDAQSAALKKGMGMRIMEYRAKMIGALLDIQSQPGEGSQVTCSFENKPVKVPSV